MPLVPCAGVAGRATGMSPFLGKAGVRHNCAERRPEESILGQPRASPWETGSIKPEPQRGGPIALSASDRAAPLELIFFARLPRPLAWADIGLARWAGTLHKIVAPLLGKAGACRMQGTATFLSPWPWKDQGETLGIGNAVGAG